MAKSLRDLVDRALTKVDEISPESVRDSLTNKEYLVLDVREPEEYAAGHIPGSINIPRGFLEVKADLDHRKRDPRLADRSQRVVCYCGGGHRSALAAEALHEMGFESPLSMAGGWSEWQAKQLPIDQ